MRKITVPASFAVALLLLTVSLYAFTKSPLVHAAAAANIVVLSSNDPSLVGQAVTFAVAVAPASSSFTYPSGTVSVSVDGTSQGSASLQKGYAQIVVSNLAAGSHNVVAT